jgi:threonyl-tRNA synthetase
VQLDFSMPERFELAYTGDDNEEHRPVMIHRALFGSFERFIGILIEHYGGEFPLWLAPVQAKIIPVSDQFNDYASTVAAKLIDAGLRPDVDDRTESVGKKIRDAELAKAPYMLVVGAEERAAGTVSVRKRHNAGEPDAKLTLDALVETLADEVAERRRPESLNPAAAADTARAGSAEDPT